MLLDSLTVSSFRGINGRISLNLGARLTLIHSPNGVGKTSLCDAAEWLFTGEIQRLRAGIQEPDHGIKNIFSPESEPLSESTFQSAGQDFHVRRQQQLGPNKIETESNNKWRRLSLNQFLARITPNSLPQSTAGIQALNIRRSWFRAARFLETHALQVLLDDDDQSTEIRDLAFSDLLGVGELQRRERDLRKIIFLLGGDKQLDNEIRQARRAVDSARKVVHQSSEQASAPLFDALKDQIKSLQKVFDLDPRPRSSFERQLAAVDQACARDERKVARESEALNYLSEHSNEYRAAIKEIESLRKQSSDLQRKKDRINLAAEEPPVQKLQIAHFKASETLDSLRRLQLRELQTRLQTVVVDWERIGSPPLTMGIDPKLANRNALRTTLETRIATISQCQTSLNAWRKADHTVRRGQEQIKEINVPAVAERERIENELDQKRNALTQSHRQRPPSIALLEQLQIAARQFIEQEAVGAHCPLCGHDYRTAEELQQAIRQELESLPLNQISQDRQDLVDQIATIEGQVQKWSDNETSINAISKQVEFALQTLAEAAPMLQVLGLGLKDLRDEQLITRLQQMKTAARAEMTLVIEETTSEEHRVTTISRLRSIFQELKSAHDRVKTLTKIRVKEITLDELPNKWLNTLQRLIDATENASADLNKEITALELSLNEAQAKLKHLRDADKRLRDSLKDIARQVDAISTNQREFDEYLSVVNESSWDLQKRDRRLLRLYRDAETVKTTRSRIDSVREKLAEARQVESQERSRLADEERILDLRYRVMELEEIVRIRRECLKAADAIRDAKNATIRSQISPLCDVITALYVRAQSASFIERISSNGGSGPIQWLAHIKDRQLANTSQMSLGQRQDLALAIFLSRARQVGGTFFLDEPLLHLDDLNRVALLDVLRTIVIEDRHNEVRLVVTTANESLVRHCQEKFALVPSSDNQPALRVYRLVGDPQTGVAAQETSVTSSLSPP